MKRHLKLILINSFLFISSILCIKVFAQDQSGSMRKTYMNKTDSLLIKTIKDYKDTIVKDNRKAIITVKIRRISKNNLDITISYILNDFDLSFFKPLYVFYINNTISVLVKANLNTINNYKGCISFEKINAGLLKKFKKQLVNSKIGFYTYEPIYWILSYDNGKVNITKNLLILPPGY